MNWPTKRLMQLWLKHFASFLVFILGLVTVVVLLAMIPMAFVPFLIVVVMLVFGISMSYIFAKADYKRECERGERVMNTLKKENI